MITGSRKKPARAYHAYLLRIWLDSDQNQTSTGAWRFSLEDAHTHTQQGFRDLDTLLAYLRDLTGSPPTAPAGELWD